MSLLLEALKKAELAKQGAARPPGAPDPATPFPRVDPDFSLQVEPVEPAPAPPVMTREKLPDITQPLEILSEDLPSARRTVAEAPAPAPEPAQQPLAAEALAQQPEPMAHAPPEPRAHLPPEPASLPSGEPAAQFDEPAPEAGRDAARRMFEVKEVEYNPKRPFYITLGVLGVFAAGYAGYVWWEMQPKYSYSATGKPAPAAPAAASPSTPAAPSPAAAPPGAPAAAATAAGAPAGTQASATPAAGAPAATTATTATAATAAAPAAPAKASTPAARAAVPEQAPSAPSGPVLRRSGAGTVAAAAPAAREGAPAQRQAPRDAVAVTPPALGVDPLLERAWGAFQGGELAVAREAWQEMLKREPNNRDALLGLAAVDVRGRDFDAAEARYQRLLELDPRDTVAAAGLIGLRTQIDPVLSESRVKSLIAVQPEATHLYFTLGNQYAAQSRWAEAQQAYFKAWSAEPDNADYAFNLAVSLDQLHQTRHAIEYYRRALALTEKRPAGFDRAQAGARLRALTQN